LETDNNSDILIVNSEEEFEEKSRERPDKSIHLFKFSNGNTIWSKSSGPISDINEYLIKRDENSLFID
jgi:hypothetical protein